MQVTWEILRSVAVERSLSIQWIDLTDSYELKLIDGMFILDCSIPRSDTARTADFETNFKAAGNRKLSDPRDADGSVIQRAKVTTSGWHFQLSSVDISTSTWAGYRHKNINPTTLEETDSGFITFKLYDANRQEITDPLLSSSAKYTVLDWCVNHEMEIVGALFTQAEPPTTDIFMYTIGAPGIANVKFGTGGTNLKHIGIGGMIDADGKAAKYLHPTLPIPGINKFRTIFVHGTGVVHNCQLIYKLFKPM